MKSRRRIVPPKGGPIHGTPQQALEPKSMKSPGGEADDANDLAFIQLAPIRS